MREEGTHTQLIQEVDKPRLFGKAFRGSWALCNLVGAPKSVSTVAKTPTHVLTMSGANVPTAVLFGGTM